MRRVAPIHGRDHAYGGGDAIDGIAYTIKDITLADPESSVDFDDIPQDFKSLQLINIARNSVDEFYAYTYLRFNDDDTAGNYTWATTFDGSVADYDGAAIAEPGGTFIPFFTSGDDGVAYHNPVIAHIKHYNRASPKSVTAAGSLLGGETGFYFYDIATHGVYLATDPITKITLTPGDQIEETGTFDAGSRFVLRGIGERSLV